MKNRTIFTKDCLDIMRGMKDECIDLIYLDPPFNSNHNYAAPIGSEAAGAGFRDIWGLNDIDLAWWGQIEETYPALYKLLGAVKEVHSDSMMSYLIYMSVRVMEMKRLLKPTGAICLHCDPTAGHYLKLMLDCVFGKNMFRNEIVWHYRTYQGKVTEYYPKKHDVIFWYSQNEKLFRERNVFELEYLDNYQDTVDYKRWSKFYVDGNKIKYGNHPDTDSRFQAYLDRWIKDHGREPKAGEIIYECQGYVVDDVWNDVQAIDPKDRKENTSYPTQKPLKLLRRIIQASSHKGDIILDPFCGCATACVAAEQLERHWIGIDVSPLAYRLVKERLKTQVKVGNKDEPTLFFNVIHREDIPQDRDDKPSQDIKHTLYGKQDGLCAGCLIAFPFRNMTKDHIVPTSKGGSDADANLQLLCNACNSKKGTGTMEALVAELIKQGIRDQ